MNKHRKYKIEKIDTLQSLCIPADISNCEWRDMWHLNPPRQPVITVLLIVYSSEYYKIISTYKIFNEANIWINPLELITT